MFEQVDCPVDARHAVNYYIYLFSPQTYESFLRSDRSLAGVRPNQRTIANRVKQGDRLICYLARVSRFIGSLEVAGTYFEDNVPVFTSAPDPYTIRIPIRSIYFVGHVRYGIPVHEEHVWNALSFTRNLEKGSGRWSGLVRKSLTPMSAEDASY